MVVEHVGVLALIGNTPLVALDRVWDGPGRLLAKAEFMQPGGSTKDRAALAVIESALEQGTLAEGQPVVEMTSGNMGSGLAVVCAALGHQVHVTMSAGNSPARSAMLRALGAEVHLVPQVDGVPGQVTGADIKEATAVALGLVDKLGGFYVDQFNNKASVRAHETGTGPELWKDAAGEVDAFVAAVGSGGTFVGVSRFLRRTRPGVLCVAAEPKYARVLAGEPVTRHTHVLQGTGYGAVPPLWEPDLMDFSIGVGDEEARRWRRRLATEEGLFVGHSSAANVCASVELLRSGVLPHNATVATVLCDSGMKYLDVPV